MRFILQIPCELRVISAQNHLKDKRSLRQKKNERSGKYQLNSSHPMLLSFSQENYALELARAMNDTKSIIQYRKWVKRYPIEVLEEIRVMVLARKDINNRGAYFTSLIKAHDFGQKYSRG